MTPATSPTAHPSPLSPPLLDAQGRRMTYLRLSVTDNGVGIRPGGKTDRGGLGTKLVENFARQLGARHEIISSDQGTTHDLVIPKVA